MGTRMLVNSLTTRGPSSLALVDRMRFAMDAVSVQGAVSQRPSHAQQITGGGLMKSSRLSPPRHAQHTKGDCFGELGSMCVHLAEKHRAFGLQGHECTVRVGMGICSLMMILAQFVTQHCVKFMGMYKASRQRLDGGCRVRVAPVVGLDDDDDGVLFQRGWMDGW